MLSVVALVACGAWLVEPFEVVSGSMMPTLVGPHASFTCEKCGARNVAALEDLPRPGRRVRCTTCRAEGPVVDDLPPARGDRLLVDRATFAVRAPRRWEVVAFRLPFAAAKVAVKRIVGLPGETIELRAGGLYVDGRLQSPPGELVDRLAEKSAPAGRWKLGDDEYFVVGDNPVLSDDSRTWPGPPGVAAQLILGKPFIVHRPDRVTTLWGRPFHVPDLTAIRYIR